MPVPPLVEKTASSWVELTRILEELDKPPAGSQRFYRGQTKVYRNKETGLVSLLPALTRPNTPSTLDPKWRARTFTTLSQGKIPPDFWIDQIWAPALLQHYGPGSAFLDVTSSIGIAMWFALHERKERWTTVLASPNGKDFASNSYRTCWYTRSREVVSAPDGPVLMVFDAELWREPAVIRHGSLISLEASPFGDDVLALATRPKAQAGHLLYSDAHNPEGPDLASKLTALIHLNGAATWQDIPMGVHHAATRELFPPPKRDQFYQQLLSTPSRLRFRPGTPRTPILEHPLLVPCYLVDEPNIWEDPSVYVKSGAGTRGDPAEIGFVRPEPTPTSVSELQRFAGLSSQLSPIRLYPYLLQDPAFGPSAESAFLAGTSFDFNKATPFLLESPLWDITPEISDFRKPGFWIESALVESVPAVIAGRATDNIFLEASPLESWSLNEQFLGIARGAWILRVHPHYIVAPVLTMKGGFAAPMIRFEYDPRAGRFVMGDLLPPGSNAGKPPPAAIVEGTRKIALKALFIALTMLRDFSAELKPPPFYRECIDDSCYLVGSSLESKGADVIAEEPYLVPKSLTGDAYVHMLAGAENYPPDGKTAEAWVKKLSSLVRTVRDPSYLAQAWQTMADLFYDAKRPDIALDYFERAILFAEKLGPSHILLTILKERRAALQKELGC